MLIAQIINNFTEKEGSMTELKINNTDRCHWLVHEWVMGLKVWIN